MKKGKTIEELTQEALDLKNIPDSQIDTKDITEVLDFDTTNRGRFYQAQQGHFSLKKSPIRKNG